MPLQSFTVTEDFVFELCQFKQQNSADRQTDRQTDKLSTVPSAHAGEDNYTRPSTTLTKRRPGNEANNTYHDIIITRVL